MEEEVIFDDELDDEFAEVPSLEPNNTEDDNLTNEVLRLRGIADPEKIKFEDELGEIIERPWSTLTKEEQLNILIGEPKKQEEENDLADDEIELLNAIRNSGMSVNDYLESLYPQQQQTYQIDQLSDEDVYALDLLEKVGADNITDEEIEQAINNAKQNETLFKKTVEGLRKEYIRLQQDEEAQQANQQALEKEAAYNKFAASILEEIRGLNSFAGQELELSKEDSEELAAFMLDLNEQGVSAFGKALQDPALFTRAAFWLLNEQLIIEELTKLMQESYKRGFEAGKLNTNKVVFTPPTKKESSDPFFDDEDW